RRERGGEGGQRIGVDAGGAQAGHVADLDVVEAGGHPNVSSGRRIGSPRAHSSNGPSFASRRRTVFRFPPECELESHLPSMSRLSLPVFLRLLLAALAAAVLGVAAHAQPLGQDHVRATLAPQTNGAAPGSTLYVAVVQQIDKGWHTYWRNPGDAGE